MTIYCLTQRRASVRLLVRDEAGRRFQFTVALAQRREWLAVFMAGAPVCIVDNRLSPSACGAPQLPRPAGAAAGLLKKEKQ